MSSTARMWSGREVGLVIASGGGVRVLGFGSVSVIIGIRGGFGWDGRFVIVGWDAGKDIVARLAKVWLVEGCWLLFQVGEVVGFAELMFVCSGTDEREGGWKP